MGACAGLLDRVDLAAAIAPARSHQGVDVGLKLGLIEYSPDC